MAVILTMPAGTNLLFTQHNYYDNWTPGVGGLYAFATFIPLMQQWRILYIGKAECFYDRMHNHGKWPAAINLGATAVLTYVISSEETRRLFEAELIKQYCPPLNDQHNPQRLGLGLHRQSNL